MNKRNQEHEQTNDTPGEGRPFTGQGLRDEEIAVMLARIEARQEFSDKQNAERFAHLEAALGVKTTTVTTENVQPGFISRTSTWVWNNKGKVAATIGVIALGGYGGYRYTQSK